MYRPPRPRAMAAGSRQETACMTSPIHQVPLGFVDPEANRFEGGAKAGDLGMWRRPVFPSSGVDGGTSMERVSPEERVADDISPGAMGSGSYITDLMCDGLNGFQ